MDNPVLLVRNALGYTQEQMARLLKCSLSTVRNLEREQRLPQTEAVRANLQELARRAKVQLPE